MTSLRVVDPKTSLLLAEMSRLVEAKALGTKRTNTSKDKLSLVATTQSVAKFRSSSRAHAKAASKELNSNSDGLATHLISLLHKYKDKSISLAKFRSLASIAIKAQTEEAFRLGVKSAGIVKANGSLHDLTSDEKAWLSTYLKEELKYFSKFLDSVKSGESVARSEQRLKMYASTIKSAYESGRVLSYGENVLIYWVLESDKPCIDCKYLNKYSPYTPDNIPTVPKGGQTRCLSHCYCSLRIVQSTPEEIAKLRKKGKSSKWHLDSIKKNRKKR